MPEGRKDDKGKLRYDLIPIQPMKEFAKVWGIGAEKYGDRNWENGILWSRIFSAMVRHLLAFWDGEQFDSEDGQEHLASVAWGAFVLMEYEKTKKEFDDRQKINNDNKQKINNDKCQNYPTYPKMKLYPGIDFAGYPVYPEYPTITFKDKDYPITKTEYPYEESSFKEEFEDWTY